jgi:hypothetical protein
MVHPGPVTCDQREHLRYLTKDGEVYEATEEPVRVSRPDEVRAIAKRAKLDIGGHDIKQLIMGMKAETEHDKPGDTDVIKGSKTARAEKLLKVALAHVREKGDYYTRLKKVEEGAGRGNWLDTRDAGWIAPDDTYHKLSPGEVHDRWIKNNGNLLATTGVKPDALGYDKRAIIAAGWIQKHGENVYSAHDRSAVPRIVKHFTERQRNVKRAMISFKTGGNVYVTRDGTVREPVPYRAEESVQENWMLSRKAAWISPEGEIHALEPGQFHAHWASDNHDRIHPSLHRSSPFETEDAMIRQGGWIKKQDKWNYHAAPGSLDRVLDHFTTHHPEVASVRVSGAGRLGTDVTLHSDGTVERAMVYENWLDTRHAAWISPEGEEHRLRGGEYHTNWIQRNFATHVPKEHHRYYQHGGEDDGLDAYGTKDKMLAAGWIRKQDRDAYYVHDLEAMKGRVLQHVRQNHPEVRRVRIVSPQDERMVNVDHDKKVDESTTGGFETKRRKMVSAALKPRVTDDEFDLSGDFISPQHRAWISPDGQVHPLDMNGQGTHLEWIRRHIPAARDDVYGAFDKMLDDGWVRKVTPRRYHAAQESIPSIQRHLHKHHPEVKRVMVAHNSGPDTIIDQEKGTTYQRVASESVAEAWRGGTLDNWLAKRTAGWIAPDHTYHQLNPGEHHREWSTNPRNSRHLRDVLRVIDPARHWDANVVQHEMMKQGWIRKLDHDQYLVGRRSMIAQALRHHERFHPHKNRVEVAVENYPTQGSLHRFYFQRDPNTREILPRRDWREKRRLRKSQQDRKWGSSA